MKNKTITITEERLRKALGFCGQSPLADRTIRRLFSSEETLEDKVQRLEESLEMLIRWRNHVLKNGLKR